jgi:hypothetical protein
MGGRQPGHQTTPAFTRERARRPPTLRPCPGRTATVSAHAQRAPGFGRGAGRDQRPTPTTSCLTSTTLDPRPFDRARTTGCRPLPTLATRRAPARAHTEGAPFADAIRPAVAWLAPMKASARTHDRRPNPVPGDARPAPSWLASAGSVAARSWGQVRGFSGRLRVLQRRGAVSGETRQIAGKAR